MDTKGKSDIALLTIIHQSPLIPSSVFPSGTGDAFESDLTCMPIKREASGEYAMMSMPLAFLVVGIAFQPILDKR